MKTGKTPKKTITFRPSDDALKHLNLLTEEMGFTATSVLNELLERYTQELLEEKSRRALEIGSGVSSGKVPAALVEYSD